jgi:hypothetical protein
MTGIDVVYCIVCLVSTGEAWLGLLYSLIMIPPFLSISVLYLRERKMQRNQRGPNEKWTSRLFFFQGFALACWVFDIATTFYAVDISHLALEVNPLGWPFGIVGALMFYGPTLALTYVLISKRRQRFPLFGFAAMTGLMLYMGSMNFGAAAQNLVFFLKTVSLPASLRFPLLTLVVCVDLISLLVVLRPLESLQRINLQGRRKFRGLG